MSNLPKKTNLPEWVDVDIANTLDLHIACSDMLSHLDDYANEQALVYIWNKTKHAADPITAQAKFFRDLNEKLINVKKESKSENLDTNYFAKLDTLLSPSQVWLYEEDGEITTNDKDEYKYIDLSTGEVGFKEYKEKTNELVDKYVDKLSEKYGAEDLDENFLKFWIDKYKTCHHKVKEQLKSYVGDDRENYFREFSDSIGLLTRVHEGYDERLIPYVENTFVLIKAPLGDKEIEAKPSITSPVIDDKLDNGTKALIKNMALRTNHVYRRNMLTLCLSGIGGVDLATRPHGQNLVTDFKYLSHFSNNLVTDLTGTLNNNFVQGLMQLLIFIKLENANNQQIINNNEFKVVVEGNIQKLNVLKDKLNAVEKFITNDDVLKSTGVDLQSSD